MKLIGVDTATERRVKRWSFGLHELISDPTGRHEFELFLEKEYSSENIHFWWAVEELRKLPHSKLADEIHDIYQEYLAPGAPCEINIDSKTMEATMESMKNPSWYTFDVAQSHIYLLMKKDSYPRFLRSDQYKNLLANAVNPCPKKKFFNFGGGGGTKKKSPNPSPKPTRRRGSASNTLANETNLAINSTSLSHHSYSTGNLNELAVDQSSKSSPCGSSGDIKEEDSGKKENKNVSPMVLRKKLDEFSQATPPEEKSLTSQQHSLEVPHHQYTVSRLDGDVILNQTQMMNQDITNSKVNVVAPWETEHRDII